MSCQQLIRRVLMMLGLVFLAAAPAAAQSEPQFVYGVEDLQMFDQPDLSSYGRGTRMPEGWFGSMEYLNWSIQAPKKQLIGIPTGTSVFSPGTRTVNTGTITGTQLTTFITQTVAFPEGSITVTINGVATQGVTGSTTFIQVPNPSPPPATISVPLFSPAVVNLPVQLAITSTAQSVVATTLSGAPGTFQSGAVMQNSSMDTSFLGSDFTSGARFEFGQVRDGRGWMVSSFNLGTQSQSTSLSNVPVNFANGPVGFVDIQGARPTTAPTGNATANTYFQGDGYDDDLDGDGVYGRYGRDRGTQAGSSFNPPLDGVPDPESPNAPPVAVDYDDAVRLPTVFKTISVFNSTSIYGVEVDRVWQAVLGPRGGIWEFFLGPRYMNVKDVYTVNAVGQDTNPQYYLNPIQDAYWNTRSQNNIFGLQLGGRWAIQRERWQVGLESRFFAAANFQNVQQAGQFASLYQTVVPDENGTGIGTATTPRFNGVVNAQLPHQFTHSVNQAVFTPAAEIRFNVKYQVFRSVYLQLGYTALYAHNLARASQMVTYSFPDMGIAANQNHSNYFVNGVNFGIVINR